MGLRQNERNPNGLLRAIGTKGYPLSMCAGAGLSVKKSQRMSVRAKRTRKRQAGWHRRMIISPVPALLQGQEFFISEDDFMILLSKLWRGRACKF